MSAQSIATQSQLEYVDFTIAQVLDNLAAHANADLSTAHGFNLIFGPADDGHGNNLSYYSDAAGNLVGAFQLSVIIDGNQVCVPANITTLPGESSGSGTSLDPTLDTQTGAGPSNWITEFEDQVSGLLTTILQSYLLPHTLDGYWEVHGGVILVEPETTHQGPSGSGSAEGWWSSAAIFVADASLVLSAGGATLRIPASTRLGGPPQNVTLSGWETSALVAAKSPHKVSFPPGGSDTWNYTVGPVIATGTGPFSYTYEYEVAGNYTGNTIPPNTNTGIPFQTSGGAILVNYNPDTGFIEFKSGSPGGNNYSTVGVRVTVTNSVSSAQLIFIFGVQAHTTCCWFCSEANQQTRITPEAWEVIGEVEREVFRMAPRALSSYIKHGHRLVDKMKAQGAPPEVFVAFTCKVLEIANGAGREAAARFYIDYVTQAVRAYWPDTDLRGFIHHLVRIEAANKNGDRLLAAAGRSDKQETVGAVGNADGQSDRAGVGVV